MATAVLIGFSCAGKSTIARKVHDRWPEVQVLDSDEWLARNHPDEHGKPHIFNLYVDLGRHRALRRVASEERAFLAQQVQCADPVLIAAGPALVSREPHWQQFVARTEPSFVYLTQSAEQAADGLRRRRRSQIDSELAKRPNFGSWDEDVLTVRSGEAWVDVTPDAVVPNVSKHMRQLVDIYERLTPNELDRFSIDEARSDGGSDQVLARIAEHLDLMR